MIVSYAGALGKDVGRLLAAGVVVETTVVVVRTVVVAQPEVDWLVLYTMIAVLDGPIGTIVV